VRFDENGVGKNTSLKFTPGLVKVACVEVWFDCLQKIPDVNLDKIDALCTALVPVKFRES
jgi:hypothetical protein